MTSPLIESRSPSEIVQSLIIKTVDVLVHIIKMTSEDCATVLEQFIHDGRCPIIAIIKGLI